LETKKRNRVSQESNNGEDEALQGGFRNRVSQESNNGEDEAPQGGFRRLQGNGGTIKAYNKPLLRLIKA